VTFHDGTPFNADAVIRNIDRHFRNDAPQFEPQASGISRARVTILASYRKIDDMTVEMTTNRVASCFPYRVVYLLMTSPQSRFQDLVPVGLQ
jgi:ABC-type transport system substrate-binding protein